MSHNISNFWIWFSFSIFIVIALSIDTFIIHRHAEAPKSIRNSLFWTMVWVICALIFDTFLWFYLNATDGIHLANTKALEFLTGYLIEKSLSVDNLFAFYMVFTQFKIPIKYQQRIFSIGIWSAIFLRLFLILLGTWLVTRFHWVLYLMGAFLFLTGIKMFFAEEKEKDLADTALIKFLKKFFRITHEIKGEHFFIRKNALLYATPLFIALVFVEISDVIFAFDSIPAIFAITTDPFIVWTSNIFAILGLRALYFVLADMVERFHMLKYGIALILVFVGTKMLIAPWLKINALVSLTFIILTLVFFAWMSVWRIKKK